MSRADERQEGKWNFENEETGQAAPISERQGELFPELLHQAVGMFLDRAYFLERLRDLLPADTIARLGSIDNRLADWDGIDTAKVAEVMSRWKDEGQAHDPFAYAAAIQRVIAMVKGNDFSELDQAGVIDEELETLENQKSDVDTALLRLVELYEDEFKREIIEAEKRGIEKGREIERKKQERAAGDGDAFGTPALKSKLPKNATMLNSKVMNNLPLLCDRAGEKTPLRVSPKGKPMVKVIATLAYDEKNLHTSKSLTAYDREVLNAVCSLIEAGNQQFTTAMVYRAMNGRIDSNEVWPESLLKVSKSIDKLRYTNLTIDYTEQAEAWPKKGGKIKNPKRDDMLISAERIRANVNGEDVEAFSFNKEPILLTYSKEIGQVLIVPMKLLDTSKKLNTTDEVTVIRAYLIRRIEGMKAKNGLHSREIRYDTLIEESGLQLSGQAHPARKKQKIREAVSKILEHFKEQGAIKDFREYKAGRTFEGVRVEL